MAASLILQMSSERRMRNAPTNVMSVTLAMDSQC